MLLTALACFIVSLVIFFIFTFPANVKQQTGPFTGNWKLLRKRWEYSHAVHAVLNLVGFSLLVIALLKERN